MARAARKRKDNRSVSAMFSDIEKLNLMEGLKFGPDCIEVTCGRTRRNLGDHVGTLRVSTVGEFRIKCKCNSKCSKGGVELTPEEFEEHVAPNGQNKWTRTLWVMVDEEKTEIFKTGLLKYYKHRFNLKKDTNSTRCKWNFHRDEFIRCSRCKKERRFHLRTKEECRIFHDALAKKRWKCSDRPYDKITCKAEEERESRKKSRGCSQAPRCEGCNSCVCFGCQRCRFMYYNCRTCVDYMDNALS